MYKPKDDAQYGIAPVDLNRPYSVLAEEQKQHFREVIRVQNVYNRLVLYPANMWHCQTSNGKHGDPTRYTLRVFINYLSCNEILPPLHRVNFM